MELLVAAVVMPVWLAAGYYLGRRRIRPTYTLRTAVMQAEPAEHEHHYDTMLGDGHGWRCGECGITRPGG